MFHCFKRVANGNITWINELVVGLPNDVDKIGLSEGNFATQVSATAVLSSRSRAPDDRRVFSKYRRWLDTDGSCSYNSRGINSASRIWPVAHTPASPPLSCAMWPYLARCVTSKRHVYLVFICCCVNGGLQNSTAAGRLSMFATCGRFMKDSHILKIHDYQTLEIELNHAKDSIRVGL
jgi:hypothetical protein